MTVKLSSSGNHWAHLGAELLSLANVADVRIHVDNSDVVLTISKLLLGRVSTLFSFIFDDEIRTKGESFSTTSYDLFIPGFEAETARNALELMTTGETRITGTNQIMTIKSFLESLRIQIELELIPPSIKDFQSKDPSSLIQDVQKPTEKRLSWSIDEVRIDDASKLAKITDDGCNKFHENDNDGPSRSKKRAKHRIGPKSRRRDTDMLHNNDSSLADTVSQSYNEEEEDTRAVSAVLKELSDIASGSPEEPSPNISTDDFGFDVSDDGAQQLADLADNGIDYSGTVDDQNTSSVAAALSISNLGPNCPICHEDFFSKTELIRHIACLHYAEKIRQFHKGTSLDCGICKTHFTVQSNTLRHVMTAHYALNYISLDNPVMKTTKKRMAFNCNICGLNFRNKSLMLIHKAKLHFAAELKVMYGDTDRKCGLCGKFQISEDLLILHLIKAHKMLNS